MKLVLASRNKKKIEELRTLLCEEFENVEILSLDDVGITDEIEEDGVTFEENALIKARVAATSGYIGVGDDSGLCVEALGGAPGIYSARYAGEHGNDPKNNALLLEKLKNVPDEQRTARFVCTVCCTYPDGREIVVTGKCEGKIGYEPKGEGGFGYDPVFMVGDKSFAELTSEEKDKISHRGNALKALAEALAKETVK